MSGTLDAQTIATLRDGEAVDAVFACTRKQRLLTRAGDPYLVLELRDASGNMTAHAFRDADLLAGTFERGDLVRARGRTERFRGELQLALERIERVELDDQDAAQFLPVSRRDLDELEGFFEHLVREVYDPPLRALLEAILADGDLRAELRRAPCSLPGTASARSATGPSAHHAFLGGLLEHTVAVATLAIELCAVHPRLDRDLLLCAALVHDLGDAGCGNAQRQCERMCRDAVRGHELFAKNLARMHGWRAAVWVTWDGHLPLLSDNPRFRLRVVRTRAR